MNYSSSDCTVQSLGGLPHEVTREWLFLWGLVFTDESEPQHSHVYALTHVHKYTTHRSHWCPAGELQADRRLRESFSVLRRPEKWNAFSHCSPQRSNAIQSRNMVGGNPTSTTACALGENNRKGPFSRIVAPCEPSTFVKGEGWSQKGEEKAFFEAFYMSRQFHVCWAKQ